MIAVLNPNQTYRQIFTDGRTLEKSPEPMWMGYSVGRWEGTTLVIDTTNFTDKTNFRGSSENMKLTERFTRVAEETLLYRFTVEDPSTFTRPWTVEIPMWKNHELMYEYACHEGNYAVPGILAGARKQEKEAASKK